MKSKKTLEITGLIFIALSFILFFYLDIPTFKAKTIKFASTYKGKKVGLEGTYWEVKNSEYAVLICPGYSCDRQKWRPIANQFVQNGISVMTFDYSGQGASSGSIGFDNAKTDSIPIQIADGIEELHRISNIDYSKIILMGHSMGGRAILRLLYDYNYQGAETTVKKRDLAAAILFSPEVNYHYNAQASLFAGTSDATETPWDVYNEQCAGNLTVYLYGSTADDIVSDKDVLAIASRLGNHGVTGITSGILHSYEMYSSRFSRFLNEALYSITGQKQKFNHFKMDLVYVGWFSALAGILLFLLGLNRNLAWKHKDQIPVLVNPKKFLLTKLLMWLPGIIIATIICCLCAIMPFGSPIMNIPYMCFISGYGIIMFIFYKKGNFWGTEGKLSKTQFNICKDRKTLLLTAGITAGVCFFVWYVLRSSMYKLVPCNFRLLWLVIATALMGIGYYVSGCESDMLEESNASLTVRFLYNLIQYIPLFLLVGFYLILKSYSGMIGQLQNMILMYIFCIPLGNFIKKQTENRFIGAVITAFLFQTLMITSAALIAF